jgi:hypothetical protein
MIKDVLRHFQNKQIKIHTNIIKKSNTKEKTTFLADKVRKKTTE